MVILHVAVRVTIFQFQKLQCISWWCDLPRYSVASVSGAIFCCCRPWLTTTRRTRWKESFRKWKQLCRFRTRTHVCVVLFLFFFADSSLYFFYYHNSWCSGEALVLLNKVAVCLVSVTTGMRDVLWTVKLSRCVTSHPEPRQTQPGHPFVGRCHEYWRWLRPLLGK